MGDCETSRRVFRSILSRKGPSPQCNMEIECFGGNSNIRQQVLSSDSLSGIHCTEPCSVTQAQLLFFSCKLLLKLLMGCLLDLQSRAVGVSCRPIWQAVRATDGGLTCYRIEKIWTAKGAPTPPLFTYMKGYSSISRPSSSFNCSREPFRVFSSLNTAGVVVHDIECSSLGCHMESMSEITGKRLLSAASPEN
jgi:hypothetical protein